MCGIGGYYSFGTNRPSPELVKEILVGLASRGTDATGIAYITEGKKPFLVVQKENVPAKKFVENWNIKKMPKYMILHTRAATKGAHTNNANNHPLFSKDGFAIVHNGMISNDDKVFIEKGLPRDAEVDSEVILALLNQGKDDINNAVKNVFATLTGSYAVAAINDKNDELYLFRHSSPISFGFDKKNDILYFASTESHLNVLIDKKAGWRGFAASDIEFRTMTDNKFAVINSKGLESMVEHKPTYGYAYVNNYTNYTNTKSNWRDEWGLDGKYTPKKIYQPNLYDLENEIDLGEDVYVPKAKESNLKEAYVIIPERNVTALSIDLFEKMYDTKFNILSSKAHPHSIIGYAKFKYTNLANLTAQMHDTLYWYKMDYTVKGNTVFVVAPTAVIEAYYNTHPTASPFSMTQNEIVHELFQKIQLLENKPPF